MKNFSYIKTDGTQGMVQANDERQAAALAKDRAPKSGFAEERTLPSMVETRVDASQLPQEDLPETPVSPLAAFTQATQRATSLARQARNKMALATTGEAYPEGILPNFGSILNNLNTASDSFSGDLLAELKTASEAEKGKFELRSVGNNLIQFELGPSGEVIRQKVVASAPKGTGSGGGDFEMYTDEDKRIVTQAGLGKANERTKEIFLNTPPEFRSTYIRNGFGNNEVTPEILLRNLEEWENLQNQDDEDEEVSFVDKK